MTLEQIIQQGGLVAVCGMLVYLLREQGKRLSENNATWVELGKIVERLTGSVERIERRLDEATVCPVTGATLEEMREVARGVPPAERRAAVIAEQIRRAGVHS